VRAGHPTQCPPVRGAQPWTAGADLRPRVYRKPRLHGARARAYRSPAAAEESRMSTEERTDSHAAQRRRLGRGLGALLGEARREEPLVVGGRAAADEVSPKATPPRSRDGLASLPVAAIEPHPEQPRRRFDEAALDELAQSIAERGVIQPVIVRPLADGRYQLVAGERRWRAAQKAQLHEIPALIRELDEREVTALALIENIQREDLNPVEEARAYKRLAALEELPHMEIARLVGKSRSHVANFIRLLGLP